MLIHTGHYEHPWLGMSGTSLTPELAKAMGLKPEQRGVLVADVVPNGPADRAGVHGSDRQLTIDGERVYLGGDVIVALDGQPVKGSDKTWLPRWPAGPRSGRRFPSPCWAMDRRTP